MGNAATAIAHAALEPLPGCESMWEETGGASTITNTYHTFCSSDVSETTL